MSPRRWLVPTLAAALACAGARAFATGTPTVAAPVAAGAPSADVLHLVEGVWDATMQIAAQGGAPPVILNGTEVSTLGGGGLWVVSEFRSQLEGRPFEGHGLLALDRSTGRFRRVWADSTSPGFWSSEGTWDPATSTLTMWIETRDSEGQKVRWREETVFKGREARLFTMYVPGPETTEAAGVTINYHRRPDGVAPRTPIGPVPSPPGPEHAVLQRDAGNWAAQVDDRMDLAKPAGGSKGTEIGSICCGGQFLVFDFKGEARQEPFLAHGLVGYDPGRKKYIRARVDSTQGALLLSEGDYDAAADSLTYRRDPTAGGAGPGAPREVETWKGREQRTTTVYSVTPDGRERAGMVIKYRRAR